ncbi:MAG: DUF2283 domain-containing protein [Roseiflexus sp.]|nr:DUF2283 domain-containing protein [Roseiflexus sp.]
MKLKVDRQADALYLMLSEAPASRSEEVSPGIIVDYDDQDHIVGIEMLYLSRRAPDANIQQCCSRPSRKSPEPGSGLQCAASQSPVRSSTRPPRGRSATSAMPAGTRRSWRWRRWRQRPVCRRNGKWRKIVTLDE